MTTPEAELPLEAALRELEQIVYDLEAGNTSLDDALKRYEQGVGLLRHCYAKLANAEQTLQQLSGQTAAGKPELLKFDHTSAVEKPAAVRRKRTLPGLEE